MPVIAKPRRAPSNSERAVRGLGRELRIVRDVEPIDEPEAAVARRAGRDLLAVRANAFLLRVEVAAAVREEPAVLGAEIARAPLLAAGVELTDAAAGDHHVELVARDVAAGVAHLDDHLLALDELRAGIV